jgi:type II secretory pathway component GspD/PulD (secretin)
MKVDAEISNISKWVTSGQTTAPQIASRHATTSAHLHSGQSFVIGGLMSVNELDNLSGIPGLMDLPFLGKLFSYHSVSKSYGEVYIMITPYIVTDNIDPKDILRKVGE